MLQLTASSETLARWNYTPNEWRNFVSFVLIDRSKWYQSLRYWVIGISSAALLLMIVFLLLAFVMSPRNFSIWRSDVWGPVFGVAVVIGIILAGLVFFRLLFEEKDRQLKLSTGAEVLISLTAVIINGSSFSSSFDWGFDQKSRWRFQNAEWKTVATGEGKDIEILQFKCSFDSTDSNGIRRTIEKIERIPIPAGKEIEAEKIIERLFAEKNRIAENQAF